MVNANLLGVLRGILLSLPIAATFVDVVAYVAKVDGISMQPALNANVEEDGKDFVLLNRWSVLDFKVHRGEVVSLWSPRDPDQKLIKRIVALEGDVMKTVGYKQRFVHIPAGYCWVEGDNLQKSMDSNLFGPVPLGLINAKASHIVWPPKRWQRLTPDMLPNRKPLFNSSELRLSPDAEDISLTIDILLNLDSDLQEEFINAHSKVECSTH